MMRHHGHLAFGARNNDGLDLLGDKQALRRDKFELESFSHVNLVSRE
ncbi:hypothetical protein MESS4_250049 [Mesorhizobium sp. STM 4661]|nr:hypothetical protein MESS4_250049 [Mesorhizobium sp. STM 4661]